MGVNQSVADQYSVLLGNEDFFFGKNHATHTIRGAGNIIAVKLTDVFMSVRGVNAPAVAMEPQIEGRPMLNHGFVK